MADPPPTPTLIAGISGPSSSGKTTLARLLRQIFNLSTPQISLHLFILHEDDFYKTDTLIPRKTFTSSSGHGTRELDDWDCVDSLDLPLLERVMTHVRDHGTLPSDFASKEDENTIGESGVPDHVVEAYKAEVTHWLQQLPVLGPRSSSTLTICLLDGFLLFPDPTSESHLHTILAPLLRLKLFIPSTRTQTIARRTKRTGYVTLEGFWADPPGYVEDVVWPNYARDHAWLFKDSSTDATQAEGVDGGRVNRDIAAGSGILVGPGCGEAHLGEILPWAVERVREVVGRDVIGREMRGLMRGAGG